MIYTFNQDNEDDFRNYLDNIDEYETNLNEKPDEDYLSQLDEKLCENLITYDSKPQSKSPQGKKIFSCYY